jgi:hypothetical protein
MNFYKKLQAFLSKRKAHGLEKQLICSICKKPINPKLKFLTCDNQGRPYHILCLNPGNYFKLIEEFRVVLKNKQFLSESIINFLLYTEQGISVFSTLMETTAEWIVIEPSEENKYSFYFFETSKALMTFLLNHVCHPELIIIKDNKAQDVSITTTLSIKTGNYYKSICGNTRYLNQARNDI